MHAKPGSCESICCGARPRLEAFRRLSIALCQENEFVFRVSLHVLFQIAGKHPTGGTVAPYTIAE